MCGNEVLSAKTDADFFQKSRRWFAASKYPNIVVGEYLRLACHIEHHGILFDLHRVGIEEHFQVSLAHAFLDALGISFLDARERIFPIGKRHLIARLARKTHGGFDGAVTPTDDKNSLVDIMIGLAIETPIVELV
jgi:hypothetical protein